MLHERRGGLNHALAQGHHLLLYHPALAPRAGWLNRELEMRREGWRSPPPLLPFAFILLPRRIHGFMLRDGGGSKEEERRGEEEVAARTEAGHEWEEEAPCSEEGGGGGKGS